jgi:hypothetical protein
LWHRWGIGPTRLRTEEDLIDGIHCNACGAELDEDPTLLPDQRPPCPRCDSLSRRFERTITSTVFLSDGGTGADTIVVTGTGEVVSPPDSSPSGVAIGEQRTAGWTTGVRGPRDVTDQLVVMGRSLSWVPLTEQPTNGLVRSLWWVQLTEQPSWMVQVVDEVGELLDIGIGDNPIHALVEIVEFLLPSDPGLAQVMVVDQAEELLSTGVGDDPIQALASVAEFLLPGHPG